MIIFQFEIFRFSLFWTEPVYSLLVFAKIKKMHFAYYRSLSTLLFSSIYFSNDNLRWSASPQYCSVNPSWRNHNFLIFFGYLLSRCFILGVWQWEWCSCRIPHPLELLIWASGRRGYRSRWRCCGYQRFCTQVFKWTCLSTTNRVMDDRVYLWLRWMCQRCWEIRIQFLISTPLVTPSWMSGCKVCFCLRRSYRSRSWA